jgi:hypothetical protein
LFKPGKGAPGPSALDELDLDALLIPPEAQGPELGQNMNVPNYASQFPESQEDGPYNPGSLDSLELETNIPPSSENEDRSLNANRFDMKTMVSTEMDENVVDQSLSTDALNFSESPSITAAEGPQPPLGDSTDVQSEEQVLSSCCIESLSLGRDTCYICSRKLDSHDPLVAKALKGMQAQQVRERTSASTSTVSFSKPGIDKTVKFPSVAKPTEDFSDLEQALETVGEAGSGTTIQKKLAKKKNMLIPALIVLAGLLGLGGLAKFLLPSPHEKLMKQYKQITRNGEPGPEEIVRLGILTAKYNDKKILPEISNASLPKISEGSLLRVDTPYDQEDLGNVIQKKTDLQETIKSHEEQILVKTQQLKTLETHKGSARNIKDSLDKARADLKDLTTAYESKKKESITKVTTLQDKLKSLREDVVKAIQAQKDNVDRTDDIGKALYRSSVQREKTLRDQIANTEDIFKTTQSEQQKYRETLDEEYNPKIEMLRKTMTDLEKQLESAENLEDPARSPIERLKNEISKLDLEIPSLKQQVNDLESLLKDALVYFKNPEQGQVISNDPSCGLSSSKRDAFIDIQGRQSIWVLKRYEAKCQDKVLQSRWLITQVK